MPQKQNMQRYMKGYKRSYSFYVQHNIVETRVPLSGVGTVVVNVKNIVGFCHCKLHKGVLTKTIFNDHKCAERGCHYFEKYTDYPFWSAYDRRAVEKQSCMENMLREKKHHKEQEEAMNRMTAKILQDAQEYFDLCDEAVQVLMVQPTYDRATKQYQSVMTVYYVSEYAEDDSEDFIDLTEILAEKYKGYTFVAKHVKLPCGEYATLEDVVAFAR